METCGECKYFHGPKGSNVKYDCSRFPPVLHLGRTEKSESKYYHIKVQSDRRACGEYIHTVTYKKGT